MDANPHIQIKVGSSSDESIQFATRWIIVVGFQNTINSHASKQTRVYKSAMFATEFLCERAVCGTKALVLVFGASKVLKVSVSDCTFAKATLLENKATQDAAIIDEPPISGALPTIGLAIDGHQ